MMLDTAHVSFSECCVRRGSEFVFVRSISTPHTRSKTSRRRISRTIRRLGCFDDGRNERMPLMQQNAHPCQPHDGQGQGHKDGHSSAHNYNTIFHATSRAMMTSAQGKQERSESTRHPSNHSTPKWNAMLLISMLTCSACCSGYQQTACMPPQSRQVRPR